MACGGRYAEAYDFSPSWCISTIIPGVDDSGGGPNAFITDTTENFLQYGHLEVGAPCFNYTTSTYGKITAIAATVLGTTNTYTNGDMYQVLEMTAAEVATMEHHLDIAASDISVAMAASGQCDCTLASWATAPLTGLLRKLNVIEAMVIYNCPCGSPAMKEERWPMWMDWINNTLTQIRDGQLELCQGETGATFPAIGWAERNLTPWSEAEIIYNRILRES